MKRKTKKRITNKKKQFSVSKKRSQSTKKKLADAKKRKPAKGIKNVDKQPSSLHTSKRTKGKHPPFKKNNKHGFKKGQSGNPKGRPKVGNTKLDKLLTAIASYQVGIKPDAKNVVGKFIKEAFKDNHVLIALMKKLFPDLKSIEQVTLPADIYTPEEMKEIRENYRKRFG